MRPHVVLFLFSHSEAQARQAANAAAAKARQDGDASTLQSAKKYTDTAVLG
jgi:hypothetical protein